MIKKIIAIILMLIISSVAIADYIIVVELDTINDKIPVLNKIDQSSIVMITFGEYKNGKCMAYITVKDGEFTKNINKIKNAKIKIVSDYAKAAPMPTPTVTPTVVVTR